MRKDASEGARQESKPHATGLNSWRGMIKAIATMILVILATRFLIAWLMQGSGTADAPFPEVVFEPLFKGDGVVGGAPFPATANVAGRSPVVSAPDRANLEDAGPSGPPAAAARSDQGAFASNGRRFSAADRNGDGRISPAEFAIVEIEGVRPDWQGTKADDMAPYVPTAALNRSIGEFRTLDADDDWFLDRGEWPVTRPRMEPLGGVPDGSGSDPAERRGQATGASG